ncbi:Glycosyl-transferase family 4 [Pseudobutyrivibrio sp. C4]|uniref:glycosyltransferase family 4 protein n=1 Tax=Pseudobutyrivibrio sp. C4 TaxID=1520803 RepID=UPI0008CBAAB9|nr:glycosyltransferase family 4 protein [Pseudobutyrivibrio sp. C4]SET25361.1 Glycosyl-transferase family 4 [Pseudobutyrivibrio sp. C4]
MKVIVFGIGKYFQNNKKRFCNVEIVAFADNNSNKHGTVYEGVKVISPVDIQKYNYDFVVVMSTLYSVTMTKQLMNLGIESDKIIGFEEFINKAPVYIEGITSFFYTTRKRNKSNGKKVVALSHELTLTGAPIVFYYALKILHEQGFEVCVYAPIDGPLREKYLDAGISVAIDSSIVDSNDFLIRTFESYDYLFVNTLVFGKIVEKMHLSDIEIIWWIHESSAVYDLAYSAIPNYVGENTRVFCVGNWAKKQFLSHTQNIECSELLYGIPNEIEKLADRYVLHDNRIIFANVGVVQERKGQENFVEAISRMNPELREAAEFWIIGDCKLYPDYVEKSKRIANKYSNIKWIDTVAQEELFELYKKIDVLVCSSLDDPMPVVVTEAMMNYRPCIVSTHTGTADLITDNVDGFVCNPNVESLCEKMEYIITNKTVLLDVAKKGYLVYKNNFSLNIFKHNILKIFNAE